MEIKKDPNGQPRLVLEYVAIRGVPFEAALKSGFCCYRGALRDLNCEKGPIQKSTSNPKP